MTKIYNFSAGPAKIPEEVMQKAHAEFFNWNNTGMNVMEMSHRTPEFEQFAATAEQNLRQLLNIPAHYHVLFVSGGGTAQFAMVPMNLLRAKTKVDYLVTGFWSEKAAAEAQKYATVNVAASSKEDGFIAIPESSTWQLHDDAAYLYYAQNETINGVEFHDIPKCSSNVPLVVDASSSLLSAPLDVTKFGCIFACAQKNFGQPGITVVIVRDDLVGQVLPFTPSLYDYKKYVTQQSMPNTPATYAWYFAGLCFDWVLQHGGVAAMQARNQEKAALLYDAIDQSDFYINKVPSEYRSTKNVPFFLKDPALEAPFLSQARERGLVNLKGHKLIGGIRASIYNAMPKSGVIALVEYMREFAARSHKF